MENNELFRKLQGSMNERIMEFFGKDPSYATIFHNEFRPGMEEHFILHRRISKDSNVEREKKEYIEALDKMVFMVAHTLRQPITNILGIVNYFKESADLPEETNRVIEYLHESAVDLDIVSKEMTMFINLLTQKVKTEN
jgi:signal transduction histidine kinase